MPSKGKPKKRRKPTKTRGGRKPNKKKPQAASKRRSARRPVARSPSPRLPAPTTMYPWTVSPEQLRYLADTDLKVLMRDLLVDRAYRCRADVSRVKVNTDDKASDDGCDAWTPAPQVSGATREVITDARRI